VWLIRRWTKARSLLDLCEKSDDLAILNMDKRI
jgi:hypothetical protein